MGQFSNQGAQGVNPLLQQLLQGIFASAQQQPRPQQQVGDSFGGGPSPYHMYVMSQGGRVDPEAYATLMQQKAMGGGVFSQPGQNPFVQPEGFQVGGNMAIDVAPGGGNQAVPPISSGNKQPAASYVNQPNPFQKTINRMQGGNPMNPWLPKTPGTL